VSRRECVVDEEDEMATAQAGKGSKSTASRSSGTRRAAAPEEQERDENYNLIAVLHRSLREAERCAQYCEDAEEVGDNDLLEFFQQTREQQRELASRARDLLVARLSEDGGMDEEEEEED
jgi:hypothetical protein